MSAHEDHRALLELATGIAAEAAALISRFPAAGFGVGTKSNPVDMVTEADHAAEALIERRILEARPHDGLLGEEGASRPGTSGVRWVFDPLDGTTNFVYGIPAYAVSIAVEAGGEVVAGVVHDVANRHVFTAALGGGAFRNGAPIRASGKADLGTALIATGFSYDPARRAEQAAILTRILPRIRDIRRNGSAALDLCRVAHGEVDGYFEYRLNPWDIAAGGLIVREAGGLTVGFGGHLFTDGHALACPPSLAPALADLVEAAYAAAHRR